MRRRGRYLKAAPGRGTSLEDPLDHRTVQAAGAFLEANGFSLIPPGVSWTRLPLVVEGV